IQLVPGFDMTLLTNTLKQNPEIAMQDLGKLMIDKYFEDIDNTGPEDYLTANFTDLSKFSAMLNTLEGFTQIVNLNSTAYATLLGQSRSNAYTYSTWSDDGNEYIDLGNFMAEIIQNTRDI